MTEKVCKIVSNNGDRAIFDSGQSLDRDVLEFTRGEFLARYPVGWETAGPSEYETLRAPAKELH